MEKVTLYHDREMETLAVWFEDPSQEYISEELGNGIVVMKDKKGEVIGFEKLYFHIEDEIQNLSVEVLTVS